MQAVFTSDVTFGGFRYEAGHSYDLDKAVADRFIAQGVAVCASSDSQLVYRHPTSDALVADGALNFSSAGVAGVTYDTSGRVISFSLGGAEYRVTYSANEMKVEGPHVLVAALDPSGRFEAIN